MMQMLAVGLGGALGAMARYGTGLAFLRMVGPGFPLATLAVNVTGSLLMGLVVGWAFTRGLSPVPWVTAGFLGGFTTFSAFSLDAVTLYERGETGLAAVYVAGSVVLSVGALFLGLWLMRSTA